jgi:hypothetical protein
MRTRRWAKASLASDDMIGVASWTKQTAITSLSLPADPHSSGRAVLCYGDEAERGNAVSTRLHGS